MNNKKGFSIGEVLIAAFVLTVGIVGTLGLLVSSTNHCIDARKQVIASKLAEEGVEVLRNLRDSNMARETGDPFGYFPPSDANDCIIEAINYPNAAGAYNTSFFCGSSVTKDLFLNGPNTGIYLHDGSTQTSFKRVIMYDFSDDRNSVDVKSVVVWGGSFPTGDFGDLHANLSTLCNTASKCVYAEATLRKI